MMTCSIRKSGRLRYCWGSYRDLAELGTITRNTKGRIQAMGTKTLIIQLNDEQLLFLPAELNAHLAFTIHSGGGELEQADN